MEQGAGAANDGMMSELRRSETAGNDGMMSELRRSELRRSSIVRETGFEPKCHKDLIYKDQQTWSRGFFQQTLQETNTVAATVVVAKFMSLLQDAFAKKLSPLKMKSLADHRKPVLVAKNVATKNDLTQKV
ncbi:hypothetical protein LXL04_005474 [Taraxacum kok-saghyz]